MPNAGRDPGTATGDSTTPASAEDQAAAEDAEQRAASEADQLSATEAVQHPGATAGDAERGATWPADGTFVSGAPSITEGEPGHVQMTQASAASIRATTVEATQSAAARVTAGTVSPQPGRHGLRAWHGRARGPGHAVGAVAAEHVEFRDGFAFLVRGPPTSRARSQCCSTGGAWSRPSRAAGAGSVAAWPTLIRGAPGASTSPSWWPTPSSSIRASCGRPGPSPRTATAVRILAWADPSLPTEETLGCGCPAEPHRARPTYLVRPAAAAVGGSDGASAACWAWTRSRPCCPGAIAWAWTACDTPCDGCWRSSPTRGGSGPGRMPWWPRPPRPTCSTPRRSSCCPWCARPRVGWVAASCMTSPTTTPRRPVWRACRA